MVHKRKRFSREQEAASRDQLLEDDWKDLNHDGISQRRELVRLADEEVRGISLRYVRSKEVDQYGNAFRYRSHVTMDRHAFGPRARRQAVDVYLVAAQSTR